MPERIAVALLMLFLTNAIELNTPGPRKKDTQRTAPHLHGAGSTRPGLQFFVTRGPRGETALPMQRI
jgi:hypothetical protein